MWHIHVIFIKKCLTFVVFAYYFIVHKDNRMYIEYVE